MRRVRAGIGATAFVSLRVWVALLAGSLTACGTTPGGSPPLERGLSDRAMLNDRLAEVLASEGGRGDATAPDYRVGPGDVLEIAVFQAEELDRTVRVRPDGSIYLPLLGRLEVADRTTGDLERLLAARLGVRYLEDPQVSVFVQEYRAHPVVILGEVNKPGTYYLRGSRSLVEMLSEAGGLTEDASTTIYLRRKEWKPEGDESELSQVSVDLRALLEGPASGLDLMLRDHDTVYLPKAGVIFVEGAVKKPGAYPLHGATTVLKAVTLAGGLDGTARKSAVKVIRAGDSTEERVHVDFDAIRRDPSADVRVHDGDVVVVSSSMIKVALLGFYRGVAGLVNVTKGF